MSLTVVGNLLPLKGSITPGNIGISIFQIVPIRNIPGQNQRISDIKPGQEFCTSVPLRAVWVVERKQQFHLRYQRIYGFPTQ